MRIDRAGGYPTLGLPDDFGSSTGWEREKDEETTIRTVDDVRDVPPSASTMTTPDGCTPSTTCGGRGRRRRVALLGRV